MPSATDGLWRHLRWLVVLLGAALAYGIAGYMLIEGWSFLDAMYMTVVTFSTVGYREVRPLDADGRIFTISLIVIGVAVAFVTVAVAASWIVEVDWWTSRRRKQMQRRLDDLTDHYIICAYGRVGRAVAREFEAEGVPFVVIDPKEGLEERMQMDGVPYMVDDPSLEPVLRAAGVERAKGLVCAVDSDATNVYITLMARSLNPTLFIVARASEPGSDERLLRAGADRVISPFVSSGRHMALVALRPRLADVVSVEGPGGPSIQLEELKVDADSPLVGRRLADAAGPTPSLAIRHANGQITANPSPDLLLRAGDLVLLLGEDELSAVRRATGLPAG